MPDPLGEPRLAGGARGQRLDADHGVRRDTRTVDLDDVRALALAERPKLIWCGGTAIPRTTTTHRTLRGPRGAMLMSGSEHAKALDRAVFPGLQGGPHDHTTAAIAVALAEAARPAAEALERAGLVGNYDTVPFEPRTPFDPSGIRLGTPAVTTRGLGVEHMADIARWLDEGVEAAKREDAAALEAIGAQVRTLAEAYPPPSR